MVSALALTTIITTAVRTVIVKVQAITTTLPKVAVVVAVAVFLLEMLATVLLLVATTQVEMVAVDQDVDPTVAPVVVTQEPQDLEETVEPMETLDIMLMVTATYIRGLQLETVEVGL
jgi:acyl-CoA hydrolase